MSAYPNYSQNNNYPNYQGYQYQNPYRNDWMQQYQQQNPMQQFQQPQIQQQNPPVQQFGIVGKIVEDFNSITANDVPMNGNPATFIKRDGTEVQIRTWTASGTSATTRYAPITDNPTDTEQKTSDFEILNSDMQSFREEIMGRFDRLEKSIGANKGARSKKEVSVDE